MPADSISKFVVLRRCGRLWLVPAAALLAAGCGRSTQPTGAAGPPPMPVEVVLVAERPVEQSSEFVGTVKSRQSTTVQPQVEGFVTRILVRSGQRVDPGTALMEIDAGRQQAAVANLESQRDSRRADVQYAQKQATRMQTLFEAGAASQAELEQAQTELSTQTAQFQAAEALVREQRVALAYHGVTAPVGGVVGDIPVRVGDSVTRGTTLTSIDHNAGLEVYVNVPVQEAPHLKVGLPVHIVGDAGQQLASTRLSFVSPAVDPGTQSVLVKAPLETATGFRSEQFVRALLVWSEAPAITVPLVAANRVNGQYFVFVAEGAPGGANVARQRPVDLGALVGNDYVVRSGLKSGERLIVSGVQKIGDGSPVSIGAPASAKGQ